MTAEFEPRDLTIVHEAVWDALTEFLATKGCKLTQGPTSAELGGTDPVEGELPWYFVEFPEIPGEPT